MSTALEPVEDQQTAYTVFTAWAYLRSWITRVNATGGCDNLDKEKMSGAIERRMIA